MSSKIEQLLDEVEDYIESCKYQPLSNTKIIVNKEEIDELIRELRSKIPDEVKQCQKIVSNQEAILKDANVKRDSIINDAKAKADAEPTKPKPTIATFLSFTAICAPPGFFLNSMSAAAPF